MTFQFEDDYCGNGIQAKTRKQAIADGLLFDTTEIAKKMGIPYPVALTASVYQKYVRIPAGKPQNEIGWSSGIVYVLSVAIQYSRGSSDSVLFFKISGRRRYKDPPVALKAVCLPGDDEEPVITIMMPNEN